MAPRDGDSSDPSPHALDLQVLRWIGATGRFQVSKVARGEWLRVLLRFYSPRFFERPRRFYARVGAIEFEGSSGYKKNGNDESDQQLR